MTLENFFTISELKDGLTSPERVKDLITELQKDQDSVVNNTKQWSTVASTIAATEDLNCLNLFIDLNGFSFIDRWLNESQNLENDTGDLIIEFLKALERLQIDNQKVLVSGIGKTVQSLVDHGSSLIREKAKELCEKWMLIQDNNAKIIEKEDKTEVMEMSSVSADVDDALEEGESPKKCSDSESQSQEEDDVKENGEILMNKTSDMELDPLDIARQVANEVERENEPSCSSSESISQKESQPEEPLNDVKDAETIVTVSQISEVAQESETGKGFSGFDLNQEVCSEEVDNPIQIQIQIPVSVVSASRATASDSLPSTPLQFEGTLGWKGSASTSAFRRIPEGTPTPTPTPAQTNSKHLDFDLNVGEGFGVPSGEESCVEAGYKNPVRMQLDLNNTTGDEAADVAGFDWWQSPSLSSSSSSSKQPSRNIDLNLNDQPILPTSWNHTRLSNSNHSNASGSTIKQESVISIFGSKVEVKNKDSFLNLSQPSGRTMEHYVNPQFYGHHNGFQSGRAMFLMTPQGPIPYMVDSRGGHVVPQIMAQPPPPPFMAAGGGGSTGAAPNNFELRQFFPQNGSVDEQYSSVVGGKRREPEGRWEFFPVNKHQQPPWR